MPRSFLERFKEKDGSLKLKVAERGAFLVKNALKYRVRLRIDDSGKAVRFFEALKETGDRPFK